MEITGGAAVGGRNGLADEHLLMENMGLPGAGSAPLVDAARAGLGDHKAPGAFRTIGEVARALNIRQHVLRYWEEQFPMLSPVKRSGNRRYYRPEDVVLIETIDRLVHREGYTLRGARLALEPLKKKPKPIAVETSATAPAAEPWVEELLAIRAILAAALAT